MDNTKQKINPNYKVVRISTDTYNRVRLLAEKEKISPPKFLDKMLQLYDTLIAITGEKEIIDGSGNKT